MPAEPAVCEQSIVDQALAAMGDIATLPEVTVKIIQIVEDYRSTANDLHKVIKQDLVLSARILKVVNSAFYGLPGQVASVDRAITLLGLSAVKNIAIAASIARLFKGSRSLSHFSAKDLWRHSVAVGVASRLIAKETGQVAGLDEVFLAGLIHDIGIMIEFQVFPDKLGEVIDRVLTDECCFLQAEIEIMGADHQAFGKGLTTKWRFPRHLQVVVGFHHRSECLSAEVQSLVRIIALADVLCCEQQQGFCLTRAGQQVADDQLAAVGIGREQLAAIIEQIEGGLAETESMLTT